MSREPVSVLLVEDDRVDVMNVRRAFRKVGIPHTLHVASDGLDALRMLRGEGVPALDPPPKVILLDLNMPKMNGIEFLDVLRADAALKTISVFILSTSDDDRDKLAAYEKNVAGYILKPVEPAAFIDAMRTLNGYWSLIEFP